jgi:predicted Zn-dependent protease with MMP-like domain
MRRSLTDCGQAVAMRSKAMDWAHREAPSLDDFERFAREAFASLPDEFRSLTEGIVFVVEDFPDETVMRDMKLESEFDILGLFHGPNLAMRVANEGRPDPTMIILYRRPILDYWAEHNERLSDIIRHVVVHEIGHHFGFSDDDMEAIEDQAG